MAAEGLSGSATGEKNQEEVSVSRRGGGQGNGDRCCRGSVTGYLLDLAAGAKGSEPGRHVELRGRSR